MLDLPDGVYRQAAEIRAKFRIQAVDAMHIATAQHHQCTSFWTNDRRLAAAAGGMGVSIV